jgi:hypothetical protein
MSRVGLGSVTGVGGGSTGGSTGGSAAGGSAAGGGTAAATTFVAVPATRGASLDILFCSEKGRAPTPPTAVKFFFEGIIPVLLDGIFLNDWFGVYIMQR